MKEDFLHFVWRNKQFDVTNLISEQHQKIEIVRFGDYVQMGQRIGDMGNSGYSFGTHLHFEIWKGKPYGAGSECYNPMLFY